MNDYTASEWAAQKAADKREKAKRASALTGIPVPILEAQMYTLEESAGQYSDWARQDAARHLLWMHHKDSRGYEPGSFTAGLLTAWHRADAANQGRLCVAFPIYGDAFDQIRANGYEGLARWAGIEELVQS